MMIKAIETSYKGYRFRSRLEARWAVFFDALGIKWEYEKEGFDLGDGLRYLPDFWLPQVSMWAEVKGDAFDMVALEKCALLARGTHCQVLLLDGPPDFRAYDVIASPIMHNGHLGCLMYDSPRIIDGDYLDEHRFFSGEWDYESPPFNYRQAVELARSARFEHGEYPQ